MSTLDENALKLQCLAKEACANPVDAALLRKFFKTALKAHWEYPSNHGRYEEQLGCFSTDPASDQHVDIMLSYEEDRGKNNTYPRIIVSIGDSQVQKMGLGNIGGYSPDKASSENAWQVTTALNIQHMFRDPDLALIAAQSSFEFFAGFHKQFRDVLGLQTFEPVSISNEKRIRPHPNDHFRVDALFQLNYNFVITVNTESHRLKTVAHTTTIT